MGSLGADASQARANEPVGRWAPDGSSRVLMRVRMEQSFARYEGIGLTKTDPAFFDAAIVAQTALQ
jgi:hypothetical protein